MFTLSFVKYCIEDMFHYFNESQLRLVKFFGQQKVSGCIGTNKCQDIVYSGYGRGAYPSYGYGYGYGQQQQQQQAQQYAGYGE